MRRLGMASFRPTFMFMSTVLWSPEVWSAFIREAFRSFASDDPFSSKFWHALARVAISYLHALCTSLVFSLHWSLHPPLDCKRPSGCSLPTCSIQIFAYVGPFIWNHLEMRLGLISFLFPCFGNAWRLSYLLVLMRKRPSLRSIAMWIMDDHV